MTLFDLQLEYQVIAVGLIFVFLGIFTAWAIWVIRFIRTKMAVGTHLIWSVGLSFFVGSALFGVGKSEPIEELLVLAVAHAIAWHIIRRQDAFRINTPES